MSKDFYSHSKRKAKYRGIPFELTREELDQLMDDQNQRCAYTGDLIDAGGYKRYTASLDRINSDKGYTLDNVQFVHKAVNYAKHSLTEDAFFSMVEKIYRHKVAYNGINPDEEV